MFVAILVFLEPSRNLAFYNRMLQHAWSIKLVAKMRKGELVELCNEYETLIYAVLLQEPKREGDDRSGNLKCSCGVGYLSATYWPCLKDIN